MGMDASDVVILNTSHLQVNCSLQTGYNTDNEQSIPIGQNVTQNVYLALKETNP